MQGPIDVNGELGETSSMASTKEQIRLDPQAAPEKRAGGTVLTPKGEERLRSQLAHLHRQLRIDFPARLRDARADGGSDMNDDYLQIKEEEAVVVAAAKRVEDFLADAEIVENEPSVGDRAALGTTVQVEDLSSARIYSYELVGDFEEVRDGVSVNSPVGQALIGSAVGDEARVVLPAGRVRKLRILALK